MVQVIRNEYQVVVVDPRHADYSHLIDGTMPSGVMTSGFVSSNLSLCLLATGRAALRAARELNPDLWIINTELPDMEGTDLFEMLGEQLRHVPVVLVANHYCADKELEVRRVGVPIFACKPLDPAWLAYGVEHRHRKMGLSSDLDWRAALSRDVRVAG